MSTAHRCPVCNGTGQHWSSHGLGTEMCPACNGTCIVWEHAPVSVTVYPTDEHAGCTPNKPCSTGCPAGNK